MVPVPANGAIPDIIDDYLDPGNLALFPGCNARVKMAHDRVTMTAPVAQVRLLHGLAMARLDPAQALTAGDVAQHAFGKLRQLGQVIQAEIITLRP
jgi:hypothetical protein